MPKGIYDRSKGSFGRPTQPVKERFWKYIEAKGSDECWEWKGQRDRYGYGKFKYKTDKWRDVKAHRLVWEFTYGPIPKGEGYHGTVIRHFVCDNPPCCNPKHLKPGTTAENNADRKLKKIK